MKLSEELKWRGFVNQTTFKDISEIDKKPITFYWGVDPSAPSMTIGNLAAAMMAKHFMKAGHKAVLLVGGATGRVGDPDGKVEERTLKTPEEIAENNKAIADQYSRIFEGQPFKLVDNYDWFKDMNYLEFLRLVGKNVPMRQMLAREFVQTRLSETGSGISYAEFSYVLIQAYDFYYMNKHMNVDMQLCGSDQWGNCIAGVDLIRRLSGKEAHVWSSPLIINKATGKKFGKTEDGAIWLDADLTSVYKFYQFWLNADDEGVEDYIKIYTMLDKPAVDKLIKEAKQAPEKRLAQKTLAYEVTKIVHGKERADSARKVTEALFGSDYLDSLKSEDFGLLSKELPTKEVKLPADLLAWVVDGGLASSKGEARRFLSSGAIYVNNKQRSEDRVEVTSEDVIAGHVLLRRGKNAFALLKVR